MALVYLIPAPLEEDALSALPAYILAAIKDCSVLFVENERTARRYLKKWDKQIVIEDFEWHVMGKENTHYLTQFQKQLKTNRNIGIISEAGCPGIADPGQLLVEAAHRAGATVKPLVGPSSILLALMASGLNGQQFQFHGYLPIEQGKKIKKIRQLEDLIRQNGSAQIFIETPYRNNQLLETLLNHCQPTTRLCIAVDLTAPSEWIYTDDIKSWKQKKIDLHKRPAIFLLGK
ncbi:MAG: SAM-dependent methyltransferase [Bacteroidetes bacterium]|nr:SAM-dependent methyltransferase [Bacteroidota bacterium]